jgi:hypothetical protein
MNIDESHEEIPRLNLAENFLNTHEDEPNDLKKDFLTGEYIPNHLNHDVINHESLADDIDSDKLIDSPQNLSDT